eukprot:5975427-Amphidinium_carterae.1
MAYVSRAVQVLTCEHLCEECPNDFTTELVSAPVCKRIGLHRPCALSPKEKSIQPSATKGFLSPRKD